jgi:guanylate kinase
MPRGHKDDNREPMHTRLETVEDEATGNDEADEEYIDEDVEDIEEEEDEHDAAVRRAWGM